MDPSIVKLLEADEDENAHSGKDVEALTAALNRDIEGGTSVSQPMDSDKGVSSNRSSSLLTHAQVQTSCQVDSTCQDKKLREHLQPNKQLLSGMEILLQGPSIGIQPKQISNSAGTDQLLLQHKQLWDDKQDQKPEENSVQLSKEKKTLLSEKKPVENLEDIQKLQSPRSKSQQSKIQQSNNEKAPETDQVNKLVVENRSNFNVPFSSLIPILSQRIEKDKEMQLLATYARLRKNEISKSEFLKIVRTIVGEQMLKSAALTLQNSSFGAAHIGRGNTAFGPSNNDAVDKQASRMGIPTTNIIATHQISGTVSKQAEHVIQMRSQIASATTPVGTGSNMRITTKRPFFSQKPLESYGTPSPQSSKKQKLSGVSLDESIEHLNDVTAVSGVNLREEEEQLFSAHKEDCVASEGIQRIVQVEEERMILQKVPLQKKISEITSKCGIKNMKDDVERCLSMCVEERMRGLIRNLIRLSKQRVDVEKPRHMIYVTSDVRRQILMMNRKAKEECGKKQAEEAEKLRKNSENEGNTGGNMDKEKDEGRLKALKANKEEDDKMRATAANVAARVAAGGDDMLSKWQLMAEQARKKREGMHDGASGAQLRKESISRPVPIHEKTTRDNQEAGNRTRPSATTLFGALRKFGWNQPVMPEAKSTRTISVKDVIAVLEREPQMARSTLIYRLYDRMSADGAVEYRL